MVQIHTERIVLIDRGVSLDVNGTFLSHPMFLICFAPELFNAGAAEIPQRMLNKAKRLPHSNEWTAIISLLEPQEQQVLKQQIELIDEAQTIDQLLRNIVEDDLQNPERMQYLQEEGFTHWDRNKLDFILENSRVFGEYYPQCFNL